VRTATVAWEEAARSLGIEPSPRVRPTALRWLRYACWGRLPDRNALWVLYDATCSTWVARYLARVLVIVIPPSVVIATVLPATLGVRVLTAVLTGFFALLFTAVWINEGSEHRLIQAGWRWTLATELREQRELMAERLAQLQRKH